MDPEDKELLKRVASLSEENSDILHSMQRSMRLTSAMNWLYWIFIIGSAIGAYYLVQPYLNSIQDLYGGAKNSVSGYQDVLDNFKQLGQ